MARALDDAWQQGRAYVAGLLAALGVLGVLGVLVSPLVGATGTDAGLTAVAVAFAATLLLTRERVAGQAFVVSRPPLPALSSAAAATPSTHLIDPPVFPVRPRAPGPV